MNKENNLVPKYRFPEFKDDGEWIEKTIIDTANKNVKWSFTGGPFGSNLKSSDYKSSGIRIIQLQNIGDGVFNNDYRIYASVEKADELLSCNIYSGDIILSKMGDPVGRACIMPGDNERYLMASDGIRLAVDESRFSKYFIFSLINSDIIRSRIESKATGSTRKRIGLDILKHIPLLVPSKLDEQQKIAACLSSLDDLISAHEEKLTALEEHKKGLMQNLFPQEGESKPKFRFPEFENDGDWVEINILEVGSMKARIGWQNLRTDEHLNQGEYYLVTGIDFKNNRVDWDNAKYVSYDRYIQDENIILKEGDILITKDGSIGKVAYVNNIKDKKSTLNNGIFRIRINKNYNSECIFHSFFSNRFKLFLDRLSGGSSIVHLYQKDFEKYTLQLPTNLYEQQKIATVLSSVDELIVAQHEKIDSLKVHKRGLMQGLFPKLER